MMFECELFLDKIIIAFENGCLLDGLFFCWNSYGNWFQVLFNIHL